LKIGKFLFIFSQFKTDDSLYLLYRLILSIKKKSHEPKVSQVHSSSISIRDLPTKRSKRHLLCAGRHPRLAWAILRLCVVKNLSRVWREKANKQYIFCFNSACVTRLKLNVRPWNVVQKVNMFYFPLAS